MAASDLIRGLSRMASYLDLERLLADNAKSWPSVGSPRLRLLKKIRVLNQQLPIQMVAL